MNIDQLNHLVFLLDDTTEVIEYTDACSSIVGENERSERLENNLAEMRKILYTERKKAYGVHQEQDGE